ncbi:MAG: hypothetical protein ABI699_05785 [Caldimonas sp.]
MSAPNLLSLSILAAALAATAGGALAAGNPGRAEVKAAVLQARADGELRPAGEAAGPLTIASGDSPLSRRQIRDDTLQARAHGELIPAGEGMVPAVAGGTLLARAEVKESTRQARLNGELIPAGEGIGSGALQARTHARRDETIAARTTR